MAKVPGAQLESMAVGPEGDLWFTKQFTNHIDRITPSGRIIEFSKGLPRGSEPVEIVRGHGNALWFTQRLAPQPPVFAHRGRVVFGKITTAGKVTEFPTRLTEIGPRPLVVGREGDIWFLVDNPPGDHAAIGRITPSGNVTEFSKGLPRGSVLRGITLGPGKDLWFTLGTLPGFPELHAIGRITPQGVITHFSAGLPAAFVLDEIVDGPEGDLWFGSMEVPGSGEEKIGRITSTGAITEFSVTGTHERSFNLAVGPEGHLWAVSWNLSEDEEIGRFAVEAPG